jgi:hypothetical protein
VECSNPAIVTLLVEAAAGLSTRIQVMIPKGTELAAKGETLTVYTDDPEFATLVCRIDAVRPSQDARRRICRPLVALASQSKTRRVPGGARGVSCRGSSVQADRAYMIGDQYVQTTSFGRRQVSLAAEE